MILGEQARRQNLGASPPELMASSSNGVLGDRFQQFIDPADNQAYIWDNQALTRQTTRQNEESWTKSEIAIVLFNELTRCKSRIPPPPNDPLPPRCQQHTADRGALHGDSMPNGMPWETAAKIGRILTYSNWVILNDNNVGKFAQSLRQQLFENYLPGVNQPGDELEQKIRQGLGYIRWAKMDTHKGRYKGYAAR